jgi:hypothetical protein
MSKKTKKKRQTQKDPPLASWVGLLIGLLGAYMIAEGAFAIQPHYWHWLVAVAGAAVGYLLGGGWYRWRGDIA